MTIPALGMGGTFCEAVFQDPTAPTTQLPQLLVVIYKQKINQILNQLHKPRIFINSSSSRNITGA